MSLHSALSLFLEEYPAAVQRKFAGDAVADFIRNDVPRAIDEVLGNNPRYVVHGSPGQGTWARVPWAAVFDRFVTESAQKGYYVVYLVREDFKGIYISLNQGVTSARKKYGIDAKQALRDGSSDFLARLGLLTKGLLAGPIDLAATSDTNLSAYYEEGAICSKYYPGDRLPSNEQLSADLLRFITLYIALASQESQLSSQAEAEEDEVVLADEDLRELKEHKRIERNRKLAHCAKQFHGYVCMACGFDFEVRYGEIGRAFIEAHHLTALSELKGQRLTLDPRKDFAVLCSNCHRMIHRTAFVNNIEAFRSQFIVKNGGS